MKRILITLLILSILLFFFLGINIKDPNFINYYYKENFEKNETNPVKSWVTNLDKNSVNIKYNYDTKSYTQGDSSLKIDIDVNTTKKDKWYYYLQIPIEPSVNLEGKLSFSLDIKTDKETSENIQIGFNLEYFPYTSGIHQIQQDIKPNIWNSIRIDNLNLFALNHAKHFISKIYDTNLSDFGRAISKVAILIRGRGSKKYHINLDNLKIYGSIKKDKLFIDRYKKSWFQYRKRVNRKIEDRKKLYKTLTKDKKTCPTINFYKEKIISIFNDINSSFKKHETIKPSTIDNLDSYLRKLKSLNSKTKFPINLYKMPPMKYYRFTGTNIPKLDRLKSYHLRVSRGEYKSIAIIMESLCSSKNLKVEHNSFVGDLDLYIAKVWYQSGLHNTQKTGKYLTQELLLKDDSLVKVDYKKEINYLRVRYKKDNKQEYIDISNPNGKFPDTNSIIFNDSKELKPFILDRLRAKILWGIVHIPEDTKEGNYSTTLKIIDTKTKKILKRVPIEVEVLPFKLDKSNLIYSIYYTGRLRDKRVSPIDAYNKSKKQQLLELKDIKAHGVMYPTSYETLESLEDTLKIRREVGFPTDRFYTLGFNIMSSNLAKRVKDYKKILEKYNYKNLYIYGIDEASPKALKNEKKFIDIIKKLGAKLFVAGYKYTYEYLGNAVDIFNYANAIFKKDVDIEVGKWHGINREIFAYASPQAGVENPEIYRRNFGCKLWKHRFDGEMDWAYQAHRGAFWNDFDTGNSRLTKYREEAFTYPTTNGIVGTIEWEGFREAITDVRYISTIENIIDKLKEEGKDSYNLEIFLQNIDCNSNLDKLREEMINLILKYKRK